MKKISVTQGAMALLLAFAVPGAAETRRITYPGFIWNDIRNKASPIDNFGVISQGIAEQAIQYENRFLFWKPAIFLELRYDLNPGGPSWYNKAVPGAGFKLRKDFQNGMLQLGIKSNTELRRNAEKLNAVIGFCTFYYQWR